MKRDNKPKRVSKKKAPKSSKKAVNRAGRRQYLKSKPPSKVTFRVPKEAVGGASSVSIVGDFNKWNITQAKMKRMRNGDFAVTLELPCNREYNFRYVVDADLWDKEWFADGNILEE